MIPLAMLASLTFSDVILPALAPAPNQLPFHNRLQKIFVIYIAIYLLGNALYFDTQFAGTSVSQANREAFDWIRINTPSNSQFLVLTGETDVFCDGISEWFPALTGRTSLTTVQGSEWLPGKFAGISQTQRTIQGCLNGNNALDCVQESAKAAGIQYDYIYITNQSTLKTMCRVIMPISRGDSLIRALEERNDYKPVYQTDAVSIFSQQR
jgi:hypothetical protein